MLIIFYLAWAEISCFLLMFDEFCSIDTQLIIIVIISEVLMR